MRKITGLLMAIIILVIGFHIPAQALEIPIRVVIDNEEVFFPDAKPFIDKNNRTQTPARFIGEALGATVSWDQTLQQAKFVKDTQELIINIGSKVYQLNGVNREMDTVAIVVDNRTFVPARYVAEAFGAEVGWVQEIKTVTIKSGQATTVTTGNGNVTYYEGVAFDSEKDYNIYGMITKEKQREFYEALVENYAFIKENGVYYVSGDIPVLPGGFMLDVRFIIYYGNKIPKSYYIHTNKDYVNGEFIKNVGKMKIKLEDQNLSDIIGKEIAYYIYNEDYDNTYIIFLEKDKFNKTYDKKATFMTPSGNEVEDLTSKFDFNKVFQW